jgi:cell division protein FtsI (penicillin-binding protein 3)
VNKRAYQPQLSAKRPAPRRRAPFEQTKRKNHLDTGRTRLIAAGLIFAVGFSAVTLRLADLTLMTEASEPRFTKSDGVNRLTVARADIQDRNGVVLATTLPTASLYARADQVTEPAFAAAKLVEILPDLDKAKIEARLASGRSFAYIKRNLTPLQQYQVNSLGIPGLYFERSEKRFYPHKRLAAHVLGFTDIDDKGLSGAELGLNRELQGSDAPKALSIDMRLQHVLTDELTKQIDKFSAIGGAGVLMDAQSGEVLAMSSLPDFDPNDRENIDKDQVFNRASLGIYEVGSVFKVFTTALALESGAVKLSDGFDVRKPIRAARFTIRDYKPKNRWLSIPEIFIYSSNIGTVHMAMATGTKRQKEFLSALGLTKTPKLEIAEVGAPALPARWGEISTMTVSYGHGISVSPLQVAAALASVVNGGTYREPTLLKRNATESLSGRKVLSAKTSDTLRKLMRLNVLHGTGRKADAKGYLVGGKTGTADKAIGGRYDRNKRIASFAAAFPMDDPRYVLFVMVDEPKGLKETFGYATGGWVAAPVVRRVVERSAPLLGLQPRYPETEAAEEDPLLVKAVARTD